MSTPIDLTTNACGCCEGVEELTPAAIENAPGQAALAYRIGTHSAFKVTMHAALARQAALNDLTTRADDDPAIALLDAWATVGDVLTFYQERIANEGYLRTATERRSVLELARAIGYELNPGVAASTVLAFTVEDAPSQLAAATSVQTGLAQAGSAVEDDPTAPSSVTIPKGTKVQSIPEQGKLPQTFETIEAISARAEWNILRPRQTQPQNLVIEGGALRLVGLSGTKVEAKQLYLAGTSANVKTGDLLLVVVGSQQTLPVVARRVTVEADLDRTRVDLVASLAAPSVPAFALTPQPDTTYTPPPIPTTSLDFTTANIETYVIGQRWRERDLSAFLTAQRWDARRLMRTVNSDASLTASGQVFAFRARLGFFGHNAPRYDSLPKQGNVLRGEPFPNDWDAGAGWQIWHDPNKTVSRFQTDLVAAKTLAASGRLEALSEVGGSSFIEARIDDAGGGVTERVVVTERFNPYWDDADVYLERTTPGLVGGGWTVFELPPTTAKGGPPGYTPFRVTTVSEASLAAFSVSGKANGLRLAKPNGVSLNDTATDKSASLTVRKATAHIQSEALALAELPISENVTPGDGGLMLDRLVLGLQVGQTLVLSGARADLPGVSASESVTLADIAHSGGFTTLYFQSKLQYSYLRSSVTVTANVARATHGETVREPLGSGDGSQPNQRFILRRSPLTYVSAATASGGASTLAVRVDGILWAEMASLYGLPPRSESYIVRLDDDGKARVVFGDGRQGARLPTGQENVVATYRVGIGPDGQVKAGSLTLLQTRPLGVRGVTNPLAASGAQAPEQLAQARANAPRTVLTLDRVVSLRDFENFARAFAGIGKSQAVALWDGQTRLVHLTVAAADGSAIDPQTDLFKNLVKALNAARDPLQRLDVQSHTPRTFSLEARVLVDARLVAADVLAQVDSALRVAFAFDQRGFGQPVTAAEIIATIQAVSGVIAVDLEKLTRDGGPNPTQQPAAILPASVATVGAGAELLTVNPSGIVLKEMTK